MHRPDASPSLGRKRRKRRVVTPPTLRVFHCLCCNNQVLLCGGCDRGQRYCNKACRALLRPAQVRGAGRIYQSRQRDEPCMLLVSAPTGLDAARLRSPARAAP
jgi:hypothetical protein